MHWHSYNIVILMLFMVSTRISGFHEKDKPEDSFKAFKDEFKKTYKDGEHENKAFGYFKENWNKIIAHNKRHDHFEETYRLAVNERMDWSPEDHARVNNFKPPTIDEKNKMPQHKNLGKNSKRSKRQSGPILGYDPFDWRTYGYIPPIRNQGSCGVCGLCAKTDAVASAKAIHDSSPVVALSVQAVDDCDYGNLTIQPAMDTPMFIMKYGIPTEASYPYMASQSSYCIDPYARDKTNYVGSCQMWTKPLIQPFINRVNRTTWGVCAGCNPISEAGMVDGIINGGPLVVGLASGCLSFSYFGSGIVYKSNCTKPVDHAVDLVGVGVQTVLSVTTNITCKTEQIPYYIVKNSWGTSWGVNGYGKVAVGTNELQVGDGGTYVKLTYP